MRILIAAALVLVLLAGLEFLVPIWRESLSFCPYCGARMTERAVLLVRLAPKIREGRMARYWRNHVEPQHLHAWVHSHTRGRYLSNTLWECGPPPFPRPELTEDAQIAVLASLASAEERALLAYRLWHIAQSDYGRATEVALQLQAAYDKGPDRRDWPELLRKCGLLQ